MRNLIKFLLIIGSLTGLESTEAKCKPKPTLPKAEIAGGGVFQTIPADKVMAYDGKIKRDHNGDRI